MEDIPKRYIEKMKSLVKYTSYNQIIREFDVYIMLVNNEYKIRLTKRLDGDKPPRNPTLRQLILDLSTRIDKIDQRIDNLEKSINVRLDNLIRKNNLLE